MKYFPTKLSLLKWTSRFSDIIDSVLLICRVILWIMGNFSRLVQPTHKLEVPFANTQYLHAVWTRNRTIRSDHSCVALKVKGLASLTWCALFFLSPGPEECAHTSTTSKAGPGSQSKILRISIHITKDLRNDRGCGSTSSLEASLTKQQKISSPQTCNRLSSALCWEEKLTFRDTSMLKPHQSSPTPSHILVVAAISNSFCDVIGFFSILNCNIKNRT